MHLVNWDSVKTVVRPGFFGLREWEVNSKPVEIYCSIQLHVQGIIRIKCLGQNNFNTEEILEVA
jgi:hypothetical protein